MDFDIPLTSGQSVLVFHFGADGAETKETLDYSDKLRSCVGPTGHVSVAGLSKLGIRCVFPDIFAVAPVITL